MNYEAVRAALREEGAIPKRVFWVYEANGMWRWRLVATTNWTIVGGSQESFDKRGNAIRAAKREASYYRSAGVVVVV